MSRTITLGAEHDVRLVKGRKPHLSLSDRAMEFDGRAKCISGC